MTLEKLIRTGAAALGVLAIASQAYAADIYSGGGLKDVPVAPPPPPLWTGFYAGIHLGAAWESFKNDHNTFFDNCFNGCEINNNDPHTTSADFRGEGNDNAVAFGGGQFGYNWMPYGWTSVVLGIEVDIDGIANNNDRNFRADTFWRDDAGGLAGTVSNAARFRVHREGGFAGDVTGRLGWTWGPAMIYAKGGFAWLESRFKVHGDILDTMSGTFATIDNNGDFNRDATLTGWTVGGGVEWLLSPSWSAKLEYLHFDFSDNNRDWDCNWTWDGSNFHNNRFHFNNDLQVDTVKLGINYHLNTGYQQAPLK